MKIQEIINYKIKVKNVNKNKALKILIYFFIVMFALTLLSRFSDSLTIPRVKTVKASGQTINHNVKVSGEIVESKELNIDVVAELKVESVNVQQGSKVKKGDTLIQLNLDEINTKIAEIQNQINDTTKAYTRAVEDYNLAKEKSDNNINRLYNEKNSLESRLNSTTDSAEQQEVKAEYDAKVSEYNEAVNSKEESLLTLKRAIEDAAVGNKNDKLNESLNELNKIKENKGAVIAEKDGYITNVVVKPGDVTVDGTAISMADESSDYKFTSQITKEQKKYLKVGQEVELQLDSDYGYISGLTIDAISVNAENKEVYDIVVSVPSSEATIGENATLNVVNDESNTRMCIPVEALNKDGNQYFIYVVSERDTILGTEKFAMR